MNQQNRHFIIAGVLIAIGIVLPIGFHTIGMGGPMFLPMHIPVLIGGAILSPVYALLVGLVTPILSCLLTGMPVAYPILPVMAIELAMYGLCTSVLIRQFKANIWLTLILGMILGRIGAGLTVCILTLTMGLKMNPILYVKGAVITGLPGIVIQLVLIPALIRTLNKAGLNLSLQHS